MSAFRLSISGIKAGKNTIKTKLRTIAFIIHPSLEVLEHLIFSFFSSPHKRQPCEVCGTERAQREQL